MPMKRSHYPVEMVHFMKCKISKIYCFYEMVIDIQTIRIT